MGRLKRGVAEIPEAARNLAAAAILTGILTGAALCTYMMVREIAGFAAVANCPR